MVRPPEKRTSRADGASNERNHDEERPQSGDLGDVAKGVSGDIVHLGLFDLGKFTLCSLVVPVNSTDKTVLSELGHLVNEIRTLVSLPGTVQPVGA
jgi:hypothetical protein